MQKKHIYTCCNLLETNVRTNVETVENELKIWKVWS